MNQRAAQGHGGNSDSAVGPVGRRLVLEWMIWFWLFLAARTPNCPDVRDIPRFPAMLNQATSLSRPYDPIMVYNLARFARNLAIQTVAYNELETAGVLLLSVTETFAKGPDGNLMRSILGAFNQNVSDRSSRNTIRTMNLNAAKVLEWRPIPFGYDSYCVEQRKDKSKKKLRINAHRASTVTEPSEPE